MKKSISIEAELKNISKNYWLLDYNNLYIDLGDNYAIRVVKVKGVVWFEVDKSPLLDGCYLFSSNSLKETLDWCYDNLNIDLMYY